MAERAERGSRCCRGARRARRSRIAGLTGLRRRGGTPASVGTPIARALTGATRVAARGSVRGQRGALSLPPRPLRRVARLAFVQPDRLVGARSPPAHLEACATHRGTCAAIAE